MAMRIHLYKDKEKGRKTRNKQRSRNYNKGDFHESGYRHYSDLEKGIILNKPFCDREIARLLKTSVRSVQVYRCRLKKLGIVY